MLNHFFSLFYRSICLEYSLTNMITFIIKVTHFGVVSIERKRDEVKIMPNIISSFNLSIKNLEHAVKFTMD